MQYFIIIIMVQFGKKSGKTALCYKTRKTRQHFALIRWLFDHQLN